MPSLLEQTICAVWAAKRALSEAYAAFLSQYGERFVYWWSHRTDRRDINRSDAQWP